MALEERSITGQEKHTEPPQRVGLPFLLGSEPVLEESHWSLSDTHKTTGWGLDSKWYSSIFKCFLKNGTALNTQTKSQHTKEMGVEWLWEAQPQCGHRSPLILSTSHHWLRGENMASETPYWHTSVESDCLKQMSSDAFSCYFFLLPP